MQQGSLKGDARGFVLSSQLPVIVPWFLLPLPPWHPCGRSAARALGPWLLVSVCQSWPPHFIYLRQRRALGVRAASVRGWALDVVVTCRSSQLLLQTFLQLLLQTYQPTHTLLVVSSISRNRVGTATTTLFFSSKRTHANETQMATCAPTSEADVSGAVAWAAQFSVDGSMRSWIDLTGPCDGMLWTASLVLLRHLEMTKPPGWWRGRRVLECSSGTGHLAVGLARLGAHVVATESAESHNGALSSGYQTMTSWTKQLLAEDPGGGEATNVVQHAHIDGSTLTAGSNGGTVAVRIVSRALLLLVLLSSL